MMANASAKGWSAKLTRTITLKDGTTLATVASVGARDRSLGEYDAGWMGILLRSGSVNPRVRRLPYFFGASRPTIHFLVATRSLARRMCSWSTRSTSRPFSVTYLMMSPLVSSAISKHSSRRRCI
jgi:hypothetical protein